MKHTIHTILLFLFAISSGRSAIQAAHPVELPPPPVPLRWTVETSRAQVAQFEAYRGETLLLEATMQSYGKPYEEFLQPDLYWQTNGMGNAWWKAPATFEGNVLKAYWSPTNDCGATIYNCFIGGPDATYRAAFRLRMLPSPGFTPNHLKLPTVTYDAALFGEPTVNGTNLTEWVAARSQAESDPVFSEWVRTNDFSSAVGSAPGVDTNAVIYIMREELNYWGPDDDLYDIHVMKADFARFDNLDRDISEYYASKTSVDEKQDRLPLGRTVDYDISVGYAEYAFYDANGHEIEATYAERTELDGLRGNVDSLGRTVSAWQTYWDGDDVRVTVTNYYGNLGTPSLYLEQKMPADESHDAPWFKTVWDERTRWNLFLQQWTVLTNDVEQNKADRAWGVYDSSTGEYSPDGLLQLSQDQILIAPGMSYQKTVTAGGSSIWVLKATGPVAFSGETENGYFRIQDGDGNSLFEIVKGDKKTVGATATGLEMQGTSMRITYSVESGEHPTLEVCTDLHANDWEAETSTTAATVSWSGASGNWVATVTPIGARPRLFAKATYEAGGNTYIRNNVATSIDKVVVGGIEYTVTVETVNGKKLLVLQ